MKHSLFPSFRKFIEEHHLFTDDQPILLAVSGGADSTAMAYLFKHGGYKFGIAHCNFALRGDDSERDAIFVQNMAADFNVPFYSVKFDTIDYCRQHGISVEMGARALRYQWFDQIINQHGYQYLATAHHKDDLIETFLLNLTRGMGINGVHGIPVKNDYIIRPMLGFFRSQIEQYLSLFNIPYCTDITNNSNDYERNKVRNQIIPLFEQINPEFKKSIARNIENLKDAQLVYRKRIDMVTPDLWIDQHTISIPRLLTLESPRSYLYELLSVYGFNSEVIHSIARSLTGISGKQFFSPTHRLIKNRDQLIITQLQHDIISIELNIEEFAFGEMDIDKNPHVAMIDADLLKGDLHVRHWQIGDYFYPLGMKGKKKISDYFSDNKFSILDKENCNLLVSGDDVVWIIGHRLDNRYKITEKTKRILKISIK